jgi:hypothetical protein
MVQKKIIKFIKFKEAINVEVKDGKIYLEDIEGTTYVGNVIIKPKCEMDFGIKSEFGEILAHLTTDLPSAKAEDINFAESKAQKLMMYWFLDKNGWLKYYKFSIDDLLNATPDNLNSLEYRYYGSTPTGDDFDIIIDGRKVIEFREGEIDTTHSTVKVTEEELEKVNEIRYNQSALKDVINKVIENIKDTKKENNQLWLEFYEPPRIDPNNNYEFDCYEGVIKDMDTDEIYKIDDELIEKFKKNITAGNAQENMVGIINEIAEDGEKENLEFLIGLEEKYGDIKKINNKTRIITFWRNE